ncbi:uncharacterized protein LACBIDRAFT_335288 [Laccaria bicolor S238N-H82]|uniref:Predicted protein n=1 Tax=Laccaria bicolor (strain S238N-H82 / ATCC MYA-4686) TaxID=486041 RepID=B0E1W3_LACBS|nr:uncharacterized protein LACBIDRAFT_335280 [Laccaria bicolor S238N-H82]XP_001890188.1 uncharacterized protein LACBIDRAFT_335288 [Laccaria bicolor S238N-H82]EDQ99167.1 predicted protein [Laccaria bicolor S238N-H82]EDQ99171.1 predicted protein [Laccaria bicolor S238N-H82]|eukprot:XP_001890184.1 predicted protein [Laccaria bicolor S238N-H82]
MLDWLRGLAEEGRIGAIERKKEERQRLVEFDTIRQGVPNGWGRLYGFRERDCAEVSNGCESTCCEFFFRLRSSWRGPGSWAKGQEDLPAPSNFPHFRFPPLLLLPLRLSRFVRNLNLESKLILRHTNLTHPLTPSKWNKTPSKASGVRELLVYVFIGRAVPAYTIAGGRPLRGRGVSIFPEPVMEGELNEGNPSLLREDLLRTRFNNTYYGNAELNEGNTSLLREDLLRTRCRLVEARNGETELTDKCEVDGSVGAPIAIAPGRAAGLERHYKRIAALLSVEIFQATACLPDKNSGDRSAKVEGHNLETEER